MQRKKRDRNCILMSFSKNKFIFTFTKQMQTKNLGSTIDQDLRRCFRLISHLLFILCLYQSEQRYQAIFVSWNTDRKYHYLTLFVYIQSGVQWSGQFQVTRRQLYHDRFNCRKLSHKGNFFFRIMPKISMLATPHRKVWVKKAFSKLDVLKVWLYKLREKEASDGKGGA